MKLGEQEVKLTDIKQAHRGSGQFEIRLLIEGRLDPYKQTPFMAVSESGYEQLNGMEFYITEAWSIGHNAYHYELESRQTTTIIQEE